MKASEFKQLVQVLSLFASVRETAKDSSAVIGVQVSEAGIKLIAGVAPAGVVVSIDGTPAGRFAYTVSARPLLQAAKVITGKQDVTIEVDEQGVTIRTSEGGKVFLKAEGRLNEAGFPRKPKTFQASAPIAGPAFKQLASVFDAIVGDVEIEAPSLLLDEQGVAHFVAVMPTEKRAMYAHFTASAGNAGATGYYAAAYSVFWRSLKHFEADGIIGWGEDGVNALSGPYELYATPYRVSPYDKVTRKSEAPRNPEPWPIMTIKGKVSVEVSVDKKPLIEAVKGVMPNDEHNRVTLTVGPSGLAVTAFGFERGMDIPAETTNEGHRSVNAEYLLKLLRAIDGKRVTIGWAQQPAMVVSSPEMQGWTILLAPVAMDGGN